MKANTVFEARAGAASFLALAGVWALLATMLTVVQCAKNNSGAWKGAALAFIVAAGWATWLRGFRIRLVDDVFEYRNGWRQTWKYDLMAVQSARIQWVRWSNLPRSLMVPRLVVSIHHKSPVFVNAKVFDKTDVAKLLKILNDSTGSRVSATKHGTTQ